MHAETSSTQIGHTAPVFQIFMVAQCVRLTWACADPFTVRELMHSLQHHSDVMLTAAHSHRVHTHIHPRFLRMHSKWLHSFFIRLPSQLTITFVASCLLPGPLCVCVCVCCMSVSYVYIHVCCMSLSHEYIQVCCDWFLVSRILLLRSRLQHFCFTRLRFYIVDNVHSTSVCYHHDPALTITFAAFLFHTSMIPRRPSYLRPARDLCPYLLPLHSRLQCLYLLRLRLRLLLFF